MTYQKLTNINIFMSIICPSLTVTCAFIYMAHKDLFLPMGIPMIVLAVIFVAWHIRLSIIQSTRIEVLIWANVWEELIGKKELNVIRLHTVEQDRDMYKTIKKYRHSPTLLIETLYPDIVSEALV